MSFLVFSMAHPQLPARLLPFFPFWIRYILTPLFSIISLVCRISDVVTFGVNDHSNMYLQGYAADAIIASMIYINNKFVGVRIINLDNPSEGPKLLHIGYHKALQIMTNYVYFASYYQIMELSGVFLFLWRRCALVWLYNVEA
jgi:hypothetical protein